MGWDHSKGSSSIEVANLDTGVHASHEDLQGKVLSQKDCMTSGCPSVTGDLSCGHGTSVAGIAAAATDNGVGIAGMGWNTPLRSYRVVGCEGEGDQTTLSRGIDEAVADGAEVVNLEVQTDPGGACPAFLQDAIDAAVAAGRFVVSPAGNFGSESPGWPANCTDVFAVAALNEDLTLRSDSNRGSAIAISAPGSNILTTEVSGGYGSFGATSAAAPFVAGAAALLFAKGADRTTVDQFLRDAADSLTVGPCGEGKCGAGLLNAGDALRAFVTKDHWASAPQTYWMPWYDQTGAFSHDAVTVGNTDLFVGKFRVWLGDTYLFGGRVDGESTMSSKFPGVGGGPLRVVAVNFADLSVSQRTLYEGAAGTAMSEELAVPGDWASEDVYFPWYDDVASDEWVMVANPSYTQTASVTITIDGVVRVSGDSLAPNTTKPYRFTDVRGEPVVVSASAPVVASLRQLYPASNKKSFDEVMGQRAALLDASSFWFPWYDKVTSGMSGDWVLATHSIGSTAVTVEMFVDGVLKHSAVVSPGDKTSPQFADTRGGPVEVGCIGCGEVSGNFISVSQRVVYNGTLNEVLATPGSTEQGGVDSDHWMPWYDNKNSFDDWVMVTNTGTSDDTVNVYLEGNLVWSGTVAAGKTKPLGKKVLGSDLIGGPLEVQSANGAPLAVTQRVIWGSSFSETSSGR